MDIDTALWVILAAAVAFIAFGCFATRNREAAPADCEGVSGASCATKEVY